MKAGDARGEVHAVLIAIQRGISGGPESACAPAWKSSLRTALPED